MTATVDDLSVVYTPDDVATKVMTSPAGGSGTYFPTVPAGISLQLGALSIVLGLLSCAFAHVFDPKALGIIIPVAFSVGAIAIFTGGIINFRAGIMVAGVIGVLYGTFWISLGITLQFTSKQLTSGSSGISAATFGNAFGTYLILWAIISLGLALPVYFVSKVVFIQQFLLGVVFIVLAVSFFQHAGGVTVGKIGGVLGIIDALFCFYISMSLVTNETVGKTLLPLP